VAVLPSNIVAGGVEGGAIDEGKRHAPHRIRGIEVGHAPTISKSGLLATRGLVLGFSRARTRLGAIRGRFRGRASPSLATTIFFVVAVSARSNPPNPWLMQAPTYIAAAQKIRGGVDARDQFVRSSFRPGIVGGEGNGTTNQGKRTWNHALCMCASLSDKH